MKRLCRPCVRSARPLLSTLWSDSERWRPAKPSRTVLPFHSGEREWRFLSRREWLYVSGILALQLELGLAASGHQRERPHGWWFAWRQPLCTVFCVVRRVFKQPLFCTSGEPHVSKRRGRLALSLPVQRLDEHAQENVVWLPSSSFVLEHRAMACP